MSAMIRYSFLETVVSHVNLETVARWAKLATYPSCVLPKNTVILTQVFFLMGDVSGADKIPSPIRWACGLFFSPYNISEQFCFNTPFLSKLGKEIEKRNVVKTVENEEKGQNLALGRNRNRCRRKHARKELMVHVKRKSWGMTTLRLPYSILTLNKYEMLIYCHFYSIPHD